MRNNRFSLGITLGILCCTTLLASPATSVDGILQQFEKKASIETANRFFQLLQEAEITDTPITLRPGTPTDTLRQQVWYWAAEYYHAQQDYTLAVDYGLKALPLCHEGNNRIVEGDCLSVLAVCYVRLGDFKNAAIYAKRCNVLDKHSGNPDNISSSLNTLAAIYMSAHQPQKAEKYILEAIDYSKKADNPSRLAVILGMASEVYHQLADEQQALDYATQAYETEQQLGRTDKMAIRQAQRAAALISLKRNDEAKRALNEAIPQLRADSNLHSLGIACNQMGLLLHQEKNDSGAVRYYNEALYIFLDQKDIFNESQSRKGLYEALHDQNPQLALTHISRYNELRDSLYDSETGILLAQYAAQYDNEQLQAQNEEISRFHRRNYIIGTAILLLLACLTWVLHRRRTRRYTTQLAELSNQLEKLNLVQQQMDAESTAEETFLDQVREAVRSLMPTGKVNVEQVASTLCITSSQLRHKMGYYTQARPKQYIQAVQLAAAREELLAHPDWSITEIATKCGFYDQAHFTRAFCSVYGITPGKFQRMGNLEKEPTEEINKGKEG